MCREIHAVFTAWPKNPRTKNCFRVPFCTRSRARRPRPWGTGVRAQCHRRLCGPRRALRAAARDAQCARAAAVRICVLSCAVLLVFGVTARSGAGPGDACRLETFISKDEQRAALPVRLYSPSSSEEYSSSSDILVDSSKFIGHVKFSTVVI